MKKRHKNQKMELRWNMEGGYMEERKRGREEGKSSSSSFGWGGRGIKSIFEKKIIGANSVYGMVTGIVTHRS